MHRPTILLASVVLSVLLLAACAPAATPTPPLVPTVAPTATRTAASTLAAPPASSQSNGDAFETKSNEGGSVTVSVKPTDLAVGEPAAFEIAMNTHSVDLSDDMTKISLLRDDMGKEYQPTAWDGAEGGGHHRSGTLTFPTLSSKPKYVELVIKGLAKVPERVFKWEMP